MSDATLVRCEWAAGSEAEKHYHDTEWGVPLRDEHGLFEFLILEGAQAGLSWSTILNKREGYRKNFADFDPEKVARFTPRRVEKLLRDPSIVRNRLKIASAVRNARAWLALVDERGSFSDYLWDFVDGQPVQEENWAYPPFEATLLDGTLPTLGGTMLHRPLPHASSRSNVYDSCADALSDAAQSLAPEAFAALAADTESIRLAMVSPALTSKDTSCRTSSSS